MAKLSKMLLNEARARMSDEEFFMSKSMKSHFEKIIEGVCKTYRKRIYVRIVNEGSFIAFTDNNSIAVNLSCDWIKEQSKRVNKYYLICGLILHECGHILYTDFPLLKKCLTALSENRLFPKIPYSYELIEFFDKNMGKKFINLYRSLDNCIEDGHIEKRILKYVPGYGECLMKLRRLQLEDGNRSYEDILKEAAESGMKINRINVLTNMVLIYAKYGVDTTYGYIDELTNVFSEIKPYIDKAVSTNNAVSRKKCVNTVFDKLIQFIADEIKEPEDKKDEESDDKEDAEDKFSEKSEDSSSEDKEEKSDDSSSEDSCITDEDDDSSSSGKSSEHNEDISEKEESESSKSEGITDSEGSPKGEKSQEESLSDALSSLDDICDDHSEKSEHKISESPMEIAEEELLEESELSMTEGLDLSPERKDSGELDLSYLEEIAAEEACSKELRNKIEKAMAKNSDDMRKTREDKFPSIEVYLEPDEKAEADYENEHIELDRIARRVVKNLDKVIKERQKGDRLRGLYVGKQLDAAHAYRKDKKIFSNKILPEDVPNMEVCVLVDCSGSMNCGNRMAQSRKCAYITWKFCQIMNIPCSVYGHTTEYPDENHVIMQCVAHKDNIDKDDGKRIFMLRPYANNRDGWALNFCAEALSKSNATSKMLMVISDGLPAARGYGHAAGQKDCQEVVRKYKKKGITFITAGIDDCASDIKSVYLNDIAPKDAATFLDFSDMELLPKAFATIIKKELL